MNEESSQAVVEATRNLAEACVRAEEQQTACLASIVDGLPAAVDGVAKLAALAEPEVTKELGAEGVRTLKEELHEQVLILAADLQTSRDRIEWPTSESGVRPHDVHSALFSYLYGPRLDAVAAVLKRHGYDVRDQNAQRTQGLLLPQYLYDQDGFVLLAQALTNLGKALGDVRRAQANQDAEAVERLWGSS